ncbi:phospholipase effector Tle1 domain-containing protein [Empedobacter sedimenti]|uniref:phospholipase effector Tle1 domain-containing protein n=1 Tax=Empedobacter sedimenti TaxID=3042610 RepID=UPI0024A796A0|nr:DUF2235 domain-containing protein [Empedobacter sedimenti]
MSIQYFVEGKVKYDIKGDYKTFSKDNIVNNSTQEVQQKGVNTGVIYSNPDTIDENDTPNDTIDVSLNVFFDGTSNNKTNTESRLTNNTEYNKKSNKDDDSYMNDFTNIARGYDAIDPNADKQAVVYIEGIGTVDGKSDTMPFISAVPNNIGGGLGEGDRGVQAKVTKGCIESARTLKRKFEKRKINVLKINVYGFSRGATAARHFVHVVLSATPYIYKNNGSITVYPPAYYDISTKEKAPKLIIQLNNLSEEQQAILDAYGYFGACLIKEDVSIKKIVFNFVGLYDTVASFGLNHRGTSILGVDIVDDDAKQLNLDAIKQAYFTLQIASDDEFRENFSLTNINSTGLNGLEFTLPGVHSDIGGSYIDGEREDRQIYKGYKSECEKFKKILEDEGWYTKGELEVNLLEKMILKKMDTYELRGTRKLSNQYDKIPLQQMFHYSKQFEVIYDDVILTNKEKINNEEIKTVYTHLAFYMNKCNQIREKYVKEYNSGNTVNTAQYIKDIKQISYLSDLPIDVLKNLRNKYLHWSVSDKIGMGPNTDEVTSFDKRKRYILQG